VSFTARECDRESVIELYHAAPATDRPIASAQPMLAHAYGEISRIRFDEELIVESTLRCLYDDYNEKWWIDRERERAQAEAAAAREKRRERRS